MTALLCRLHLEQPEVQLYLTRVEILFYWLIALFIGLTIPLAPYVTAMIQ